jgi:Na+/phosphate symporter
MDAPGVRGAPSPGRTDAVNYKNARERGQGCRETEGLGHDGSTRCGAHRHIDRMRESADFIDTELAFLDAITHLEEIGDRAVGIVRLAEKTRRM